MNLDLPDPKEALTLSRATWDGKSPSFIKVHNESTMTVKVNYKLPPSIYEYSEGISGYITMGSSRGQPRVRCTFLILCLFWVNLLLNASYGICAPFLPMMADERNISQSYLGIMFCVYSISMAMMSPFVGKYQFEFGRRNMAKYGMLLAGIPFLGFYLNEYSTNSTFFIAFFMLMRILQGIGTSMVQTSAYSMLTLTYPQNVSFVVGCLETSAGVGLSIGPVIGTILFEVGGIPMPFLTFFVVCTTIGLVVKNMIPESVDLVQWEEAEVDTSQISYISLLSNKRILFSNLCVFLAVFQFTFIDPLLANYMHKQFGIGYQISGYFFLAIGWGYTLSCFLVHFTLDHFTNMRTSIMAAFFVGLFTMTYGASNILHIDTSMVLLASSLLVAGFANSHLLIPPMDEMIAVGQETVCILNL